MGNAVPGAALCRILSAGSHPFRAQPLGTVRISSPARLCAAGRVHAGRRRFGELFYERPFCRSFGNALLVAISIGGLRALKAFQAARAAVHSREESGLVWHPFSESAITDGTSQGKTVFVDVTADWCLTCKVNERLVLADAEVVRALKNPD